jgi:hypothetical protein
MAEPHVIAALKTKRTELSGELGAAEKRIAQIATDLKAIDGALRVFDPKAVPTAIRQVLRRKAPVTFRHGVFGRVVRDVLRRSGHPLGSRDIARQVAAENRLDASGPTFDRLVAKVRATLWRSRGGLVAARQPDGSALWSVAGEDGPA